MQGAHRLAQKLSRTTLAAVAGQMDGGSAVGDREIGSELAGLRGVRASVAGGKERQRQGKQEDEGPE